MKIWQRKKNKTALKKCWKNKKKEGNFIAPQAEDIVEIESEPRCTVTEIVEDEEDKSKTKTKPNASTHTAKVDPPPAEPPATSTAKDAGDRKVYQADSECYNGAVRDTYSWSQTITDCDIRVKVPKTVKKGSSVKVHIKKKQLSVSYKDSTGEWIKAMDGPLTWDIRVEDAIWSLVPGEHIHINLEKVQERWWEGVLEGEPKINVKQIDASRPYSDLDDEAQAKLSEMMYNEQQKRMGLPPSHEKNTHEMLKKAWNAKGSPFAGQPFDPSKISVDPSGMVNINS